MVIDCHVHLCATVSPNGRMSKKLLGSVPFKFMRWRLGLDPAGERFDSDLVSLVDRLIVDTPTLHAAVMLAFDAVYDHEGHRDDANTHLYVSNDYVAKVAREHSARMLFGASVHPYRTDAVAELERCAAMGAALIKWLPIVQNFNPADPLCEPFYEALAALNIPLLCHTGGEHSLPTLDKNVADPNLLIPALRRGVKVIMAHCGTHSYPGEADYLPNFVRLAKEYEHCYGDTAALDLPTRSYAYNTILKDKIVNQKIVHGSDWPILPVPPTTKIGVLESLHAWAETNWIKRDIDIKRALGFDDNYWNRAATIVRKPT